MKRFVFVFGVIWAVGQAAAMETASLKQRVLDLGVEHILFATRGYHRDAHWYANFGYHAGSVDEKAYGQNIPGCLSVLSLKTGAMEHLLKDKAGGVRDPQLSYDGNKILFSYRKGGSDHYHLYEIKVDGSGLKQLTDGIYDDIEPTYLPSGGIMFCSSRAQRWVNCWNTQVATLHRCNEDGTDIQLISPNVEQDNAPWPLPDGRMIYTRWEYVDRAQGAYHHLWTTNPDGTQQMVYFGNMHPNNVYIDAKPIPGTDELLCIDSPRHGVREHGGNVIVLSNRNGPDDLSVIRTIAEPDDHDVGFYGMNKAWFRDPYPLSEELFLVGQKNQLLIMDMEGNREVLYELPEKQFINEPRPIRARARERIRPNTTDPSKKTGTLVLMDAYMGRNMDGIEPGAIKNLLVMETLPKPVNYSGSMEPMSWGGTFTLERILGKIPVEADGSAHMELPAKRSLFFIALDENDQAVKRMQSFLTVMPGEVTSCLGCHEQRTETPDSNSFKNLEALSRPASKIEPVADVPGLFDYPRDIQPILDRHCVSCHNPRNPKGGVQLTGDLGPLYSHSYFWLSQLKQLGDNRNMRKSNYPPYALGDAASGLMKKIRTGHGKVKLSDVEIKTIQYWLHAGAPYLGSYAGLGTGMIGADFANSKIDRYDLHLPSVAPYQDVLQRRCAACHETVVAAPDPKTDFCRFQSLIEVHKGAVRPLPNSASDVIMNAENIQYGASQVPYLRHAVFNLTRPEWSKLLRAPLAEKAGGYGACRKLDAAGHATDQPAVVFESKEDLDYQLIKAMIEDTSELLHTRYPRWYMEHFTPHPAYTREMKRYGVLPADFDAETDRINVYETDENYFQQQHYQPKK